MARDPCHGWTCNNVHTHSHPDPQAQAAYENLLGNFKKWPAARATVPPRPGRQGPLELQSSKVHWELLPQEGESQQASCTRGCGMNRQECMGEDAEWVGTSEPWGPQKPRGCWGSGRVQTRAGSREPAALTSWLGRQSDPRPWHTARGVGKPQEAGPTRTRGEVTPGTWRVLGGGPRCGELCGRGLSGTRKCAAWVSGWWVKRAKAPSWGGSDRAQGLLMRGPEAQSPATSTGSAPVWQGAPERGAWQHQARPRAPPGPEGG